MCRKNVYEVLPCSRQLPIGKVSYIINNNVILLRDSDCMKTCIDPIPIQHKSFAKITTICMQ
jgi:hypothetical protein